MFDEILTDQLASAKTLLVDVANASEANKAEVEEGARLLAQAREAADTARWIFDAAVAARIGKVDPGVILDKDSLERVLRWEQSRRPHSDCVRHICPILFPEVFLRDNPGFDVLIGNPPWEKLHVEERQWWGLRLPGLRSMRQRERDVALASFRANRPDLETEYQRDLLAVRETSEAVGSRSVPRIGLRTLIYSQRSLGATGSLPSRRRPRRRCPTSGRTRRIGLVNGGRDCIGQWSIRGRVPPHEHSAMGVLQRAPAVHVLA